ncbi:MAG: hypothetical protein JKY95_02975 [Planctomycetaceae bacterium]|nr:hypothetical protein [Planctomycetaceae bacterium]
MKWPQKTAVVCGAVPLICGISIFLLWLLTRWEWLMGAGLITLGVGIVLFLIGILSLFVYWTSGDRDKRNNTMARFCAGLLLINFPVAGLIVVAFVSVINCYTVVVHNDSPEVIRNINISGGGCEALIDSIPPNGSARRSFWIQYDGEIVFQASSKSHVYREVVDDYVTNGMGGRTEVTVEPDGTITDETVIH